MKDKYLKTLYQYNENDNSYHIVIDLDTYREVYSSWDYSPLSYRDLDDELIEYLMDCSNEIGLKRNIIIDFYIPKGITNGERESKSIKGFRSYFYYRIRKLKSERFRRLRISSFLLIIGIVLLSLANLLDVSVNSRVASRLLTDGLFIGGWVAIWEIFSTLFFVVSSINHKLRHYKRLQNVSINYKEKEPIAP